MHLLYLFHTCFCLTVCSSALVAFSNVRVQRTIDASGYVVSVQTVVDVRGSGPEYMFLYNESEVGHLYGFSVSAEAQPLAILYTKSVPVGRGSSLLGVVVNTSAEAPPAFQLRATALFSEGAVVAVPEKRHQAERQTAKLRFSAHFLSPYPTESQSLRVQLASGSIVDYGPTAPPPVAFNGATADYGPYGPIPPVPSESDHLDVDSSAPSLALRFEHTTVPWIHVASAVRDVVVSHWTGTAAIVERYELENVR